MLSGLVVYFSFRLMIGLLDGGVLVGGSLEVHGDEKRYQVDHKWVVGRC
jgi:hypothetical protein